MGNEKVNRETGFEIVGEYDKPCIPAAADYMKVRISDFRQVTLPDAAHMVNMDQPEKFEEVVVELLIEK